MAAAAAVASAGATDDIGSVVLGSTTGSPTQNICAAMVKCTYLPFSNVSDPSLQVPFDGTVTSFSVNSGSGTGSVELRILRPASGGQFTGAGTSPPESLTAGINTFSVLLPVKAGDVIGLDNDSSALMFDTSNAIPLTAYYELPSLADGATGAPNQPARTGYRLLLSAVVVPSTTSTGTTSSPPPATAPTVADVSQSHRRWREGRKLANLASARKPPVGTTFRFRLNESATVRFAFKQQKCGHKCGHGALSYAVTAGRHKLSFEGRISGHRRLEPGRYTVTISATSAAGLRSQPRRLSFTILAG